MKPAKWVTMFVLLWSVISGCAAPATPPDSNSPASQNSIEPTLDSGPRSYEGNGLTVYLKAEFPQTPATMNVYTVKGEELATADSARSLAAQFKMNCDPTHPPSGYNCLATKFFEGILRGANGQGAQYFDIVSFHGYPVYDGNQPVDETLINWAARGGVVVALATDGDEQIAHIPDHVLWVPETPWLLSPVTTVIPLQLLAYHIAAIRGLDVDQPRNLAKSVTVE